MAIVLVRYIEPCTHSWTLRKVSARSRSWIPRIRDSFDSRPIFTLLSPQFGNFRGDFVLGKASVNKTNDLDGIYNMSCPIYINPLEKRYRVVLSS